MRLLDDPYLKPFEEAVRARARAAEERLAELTGGRPLLEAVAANHAYYGLHRMRGRAGGWVFREWAPHATALTLVGDFSSWHEESRFVCSRVSGTGDWECRLPADAIHAGDHYLVNVCWPGGGGLRVPVYARYVVQDPKSGFFSARVEESRYRFRHQSPPRSTAPRIYEAHVGMATEEGRVGTYDEFRENILPRIRRMGYDTVQLMAIMEHPYYGSFGYHVSSFFAPSSRFGTPDDLRRLVDAAHGLGLHVIMDLVHSHAVKNERDGLARFDGTEWQYFHDGPRGWHSAWDSRCFDYGKAEVLRFLLSNCRYWLEEFRFDGFRFDGVTSMLYYDHGLGRAFTSYGDYFDGSVDEQAWIYLNLANRVIHAVRPEAITIAEDVSGIPGCASPVADCGLGFDYRMAMGEPDYWFHLAEKERDEDWSMRGLYHALTDKRPEERVVSYVESHDQALVGGKTFFFQLADAAIYWGMAKGQHGLEIDRAIALHKMARLATAALSGGAYLNFMGNEFGHPEWIDFPREGNGHSYAHARRQWSLADDPGLRFGELGRFDAAMLALLTSAKALFADSIWATHPTLLAADDGDKVLAFVRGNLLFVFNFNPYRSFENYGILVPPASDWRHVLDTDEPRFGGEGRLTPDTLHAPQLVMSKGELVQQIQLYLPARTALVLGRV